MAVISTSSNHRVWSRFNFQLSFAHPQYDGSIVSIPHNSDFHHGLLRDAGAEVWHTGDVGAVSVCTDGRAVRLETRERRVALR